MASIDATFLILNLYMNFPFLSSDKEEDLNAVVNYNTIDSEKDPYNEAKNLVLFKNSLKYL